MILVTGATGFIGEQLVRTLLQKEERLRLLVRSPERAAALFGPGGDGLEIARGDLTDPASIQRALDGVERVYHLASRISFQAPLARMRAVNVEGTRNLMEACRQAGVRRVLHMSSIAAGGPAVRGPDGRYRPRTEADPPAPLADAYGQTKWEQEQLVLTYPAQGVEAVLVRPSSVFGPGDPAGVNTLLWMIKRGRLPFYLGSAQGPVNLVFIRDLIHGTIAAMERGRSGEIYNLVGPNLTQEQLFGLLAQVSGGRAPFWTMPTPALLGLAGLVTLSSRLALGRRSLVHPHDVRNWTAPWMISDEKARRELGFTQTDLAAALRETLAWLSQHRSAGAPVHVE
ncbi:MAG: NAD-dependent epimerase/dehydratase family protein [Bacillota bacterium]